MFGTQFYCVSHHVWCVVLLYQPSCLVCGFVVSAVMSFGSDI
jgi:hypothetical protein